MSKTYQDWTRRNLELNGFSVDGDHRYLLGDFTVTHNSGKTITLQTLAENFSRMGVPVFMADVKGDLAGLSQAGELKGKVKEQWGKLTDDEIDQINGNREQLEGKLQERYGYQKDQAKKAIDDWSSSH